MSRKSSNCRLLGVDAQVHRTAPHADAWKLQFERPDPAQHGLIHLPTTLIDFVIAHELVHLRVHQHGRSFERQLDRVAPDWRSAATRLATVHVEGSNHCSGRGGASLGVAVPCGKSGPSKSDS